ncbi:MAG: ketopantoate reductase family protein, partial [Oscillospiraceae bacterium]|nr:ketopantoate reductase family protein [Oscillospiraceae bacterium]
MKVLVIGTGAVGCAVAIAAANAGMDTAVLARSTTAAYIKEHGLKRIGIFGELTIPAGRISVYESYDQVEDSYDYIAVAVKTMANKTVAEELAAHPHIAGQNGRIILFQNGWGNDEVYLEHFPISQVFNARVIT